MKKQYHKKGEKQPPPEKPHPFARFEKKKSGTSTHKKSFQPKKREYFPKRKTEEQATFETGLFPTPLNKYLAHCGVCARRKAVEHIREGEVKVNNKIILEPGFKVNREDKVTFKGKLLHIQQQPEYILLNKPKDCLTTTNDPRGRKTVMDLVSRATKERIYPVGRLDRNTCGLLLITNDGELAQQLSHPSGKIKKVYHVTLDKPLTKGDFDQIMTGVELEDGKMQADALAFVESEDHLQVGIEIHSGKNRIVRRIFEHLGYEVKQLDRVLYAGLTKKNLPRGKWRRLSEKEVRILKHFTLGKKVKTNPKRKS